LLLDADGDLVITSDLQWTYGIDAVVQSCRIALQMFQGEWFLDLDAGIPYWDQILGQKPDIAIAVARDEFRRELLSVSGVLEVVRLEVTFDGPSRALTVTWQVRTALGETPIDTLDLEVA
jgi:hypothetical protein